MSDDLTTEARMSEARRKFIASCGKFAVVTPPAIALLLSASHRDYATAASHQGFRRGPQGNNGFGNGGGDGVPGNSGISDENR
jgi:hypothetical protein